MRKSCVILLAGLAANVFAAYAQETAPLRLVQTIPMPNVEGRIDHFAVDLKSPRLFMAALGNNTVEVIDLGAGRRIQTVSRLRQPQGVTYVPELNKIFVANGGDGRCRVFAADSFKLVDKVEFSSDADNVRYDPAAKEVYVGYGNGALGVLDATTDKRLGDIHLEGHPESFQLEISGPRIFVNVPQARHIAVIDRRKRAVVARWPIADAQANFPMTLDEAHHRLFITCRKPAEAIIFDATTGNAVARLPVVGDADDMFYDASHHRVYISGGEGFISVIEQLDADHYRGAAKVPTAPGARTSFFVPELNRLYLAVPQRGGQRGELRVYEALP